MPGTISRCTLKLKARPARCLTSGSPIRRAPCPSRLPIATSAPVSSGGRNRGSSPTGIDRSASQMNR
jgi:hypothetical protein